MSAKEVITKHFVVVNDWACKYESGVTILSVKHSMEEAKEIFNQNLAKEKEYAEKLGFTIYDDCETVFDAGDKNGYIGNHTNLYIEEV